MAQHIEPSTAAEWKRVGDTNEIATALTLTQEWLEQVLKGERVSCVVFGGSGMGKNYLVDAALKKHAPKDKDGNVLFIDSKANTPIKLLDAFHDAQRDREQNNAKRKRVLPIVFNEARTQFSTPAQLDIMKIATDTETSIDKTWREYTWTVMVEDFDKNDELVEKPVKHKGVSLACPIIAMTNMQLTELPGDSVDAVRSRCRPIEIPPDRYTAWEYVVWLALTSDLLTWDNHQQPVPLKLRSEMIDWFTRNMMRLQQVSVRTMKNVMGTFLLAKPHLLQAELSQMLAPKHLWKHGHPPQLQDWGKLRRELT